MTSTAPETPEAPEDGEPLSCPPDHVHGQNGTCYVNHKCRCADCRRGRAEYEFWRQAHKGKRQPFIDGTGTRRRLQALSRMGWSQRAIGERFGQSEVAVGDWYRAERVTPATAKKVAGWYAELSMQVPQPRTRFDRYSVGSTRGRARAAGWPPPLAWDDDTIDDPEATPANDWAPDRKPTSPPNDRLDETIIESVIRGDKSKISPLERRAVVTELNARRWSANRIAGWIGCNVKTIERIRAELGLPIFTQQEMRDAA